MTKVEVESLKEIVMENRLQGLWRLMRGFRGIYLAAALAIGLAAISRTAFYFLLRYFIDEVLGQPGMGRVVPLIALGFVALALVQGAFTFLSGKLAARTAEGVALRLRDYLYDHLQRLTFAYHDKTPTGELIQRATSDVDALHRFFGEQAIGVGRIVLLFIVNWAALFWLNVQLALISVVLVPLIVVVSILFFRRVSAAYEAFQEQEARLSATLQENLSAVRVVKAFARQEFEQEKFGADNGEMYRRGRRLLLMHAAFWPISDILCGIQMLAGFLAGALLAIDGTITPGDYLAYAGLLIWVIWPIRNLGRFIVQMSTGLVSFSRVAEVIRQEREPLLAGSYVPPDHVQGHIAFEDVSFAYAGGSGEEAPALQGITFEARPGQVVALLGFTGSGKSTLVNLLPRFYDYTEGCLTLDGVDLLAYPRAFLRREIGIVEQEPFLFSRTIRENITYGVDRAVSDAEVEAAARAAAIHEVIVSFPEGYSTLVGEKGVTLSGGQKQRVAIARTLLKDPRILILDDATSSVDTETEAAIRTALRRLMRGRTTFVIAHRIQSVMSADLILVLEKGRIVQQGRHAELLAVPGPYRRIYELQSRVEEEVAREVERAAVPA
ncbi:MAG: ABC transporter ATP-binding protein [Candidatus Promineifilaceae bacterium]|nr:ABC transporter ATP-binding protein [Candidatus Promineifilaceae bacterium]